MIPLRHICTLLALAGSALTAGSSIAQTCSESILASTPLERFTYASDDVVEDQITGLAWYRCPLGFSIDPGDSDTRLDDRCVAGAQTQFGWEGAFTEAADLSGAGAGQARLPNVKELLSIVENQCHGPAVNLEVFPDTPVAGRFLTTSNNSLGAVYVVQATDGEISARDPTDNGAQFYVRVIRE